MMTAKGGLLEIMPVHYVALSKLRESPAYNVVSCKGQAIKQTETSHHRKICTTVTPGIKFALTCQNHTT